MQPSCTFSKMKLIITTLIITNLLVYGKYLNLHSNYERLYKGYNSWVPNSFTKSTTYQFAKVAHIESCVKLKVKLYGKSYGRHLKYCVKRAEKFIKETQELVEEGYE